jgi:hypothetical protein
MILIVASPQIDFILGAKHKIYYLIIAINELAVKYIINDNFNAFI